MATLWQTALGHNHPLGWFWNGVPRRGEQFQCLVGRRASGVGPAGSSFATTMHDTLFSGGNGVAQGSRKSSR